MTERTAVNVAAGALARSRPGVGTLGTPPDCSPYYNQPALPRHITPGQLAPIAPTDLDTRERFHEFSSIVCPAANGVATLLAAFTCPAGSKGKAVGLICFYDGSLNVEGDVTNLFFTVRLNGTQPVRNYNSIPNTLGGLATGPFPIPAGINLYAGDLLELLVTVPVGSPIAVGAPNRMNGHLIGYYWPLGQNF